MSVDITNVKDYKQFYNSLQDLLLSLQSIDSKGYLNKTNLLSFPVIKRILYIFTKDKDYKEGANVVEAYK
jgi:hypothetical protein